MRRVGGRASDEGESDEDGEEEEEERGGESRGGEEDLAVERREEAEAEL